MKKLLLLCILAIAPFLQAEIAVPDKPASYVLDDANIFEQSARERLSRVLQAEFKKYKITVYVATMPDLEKADPVAYADKLQQSWITSPIGLVLLYTRNNDKISISLTPDAYKKMVDKDKLDDLATEIDRYNLEGPTRGIPKAVNAILSRLRVAKDETPAIFQTEKQASPLLLLIPIGIVLTALGYGLWKLYRFLDSHNVFDHAYQLHSRPVAARYGATQGGLNMGVGRFQ